MTDDIQQQDAKHLLDQLQQTISTAHAQMDYVPPSVMGLYTVLAGYTYAQDAGPEQWRAFQELLQNLMENWEQHQTEPPQEAPEPSEKLIKFQPRDVDPNDDFATGYQGVKEAFAEFYNDLATGSHQYTPEEIEDMRAFIKQTNEELREMGMPTFPTDF